MLKTLFRSLREHKKGSIFTILLSILEAAFEITIPLCMAELIDKGIELGEMRAVWKFGIILLLFAAMQLITGVLSAHIAAKTSVGFAANLRQDMYDNVQTFAFSNIDKFSTASIVTRLTTDVTNIQNAYQMMIRMAVRAPIMLFFMYACMILISWIGAKAIVASGNNGLFGMTTGDLTALFSYATQILTSLMALSMVFAMIIISFASAQRIAEILDEKTDIANPKQPILSVKDGSISFEDVDFVYSEKANKKVLDNINLKIASGETVGIIGGTGASKSSLVQLIPRLYDVTSGKLTLGGEDVKNYNLDTLRNAVAMVLQKNELFSGTMKENLRWGNEKATDEEIEDAYRDRSNLLCGCNVESAL